MSKVNINGVWKDLDKVFVNIGGIWKEVEKMFCNIGGAWKEVEGLREFGDILWTLSSYHGELDIFMDSSGNTFRAVSYKYSSEPHKLEKIGPDGKLIWSVNIPGDSSNTPPLKRYGGIDTNGNIYLFTFMWGSMGIVSKYNSVGTQLWQAYSSPKHMNTNGGPVGIIDKHGNSYYRVYDGGTVYAEKRAASNGALLHTYFTDARFSYSEAIFAYNSVNDRVFLATQQYKKGIIRVNSITNGSATPTLLFTITHTTKFYGYASISNIVVDNANNFYILYTSYGSDNGSEMGDYTNLGTFLEKYNSSGTKIWSKSISMVSSQLIIDLVQNMLYFLETDYSKNIDHLVKMDLNGNELGRFSVASSRRIFTISSNIVTDVIPLSIQTQLSPQVYVTHCIQK